MTDSRFLTAAFYKFVELTDIAQRRQILQDFCEQHQIKGLILLAKEGINSTVAGQAADVHALLDFLRSDPRLADLQHKESWAAIPPFRRMKVKLKKEIVTMGVDGISPVHQAGTYVKPADWNALISDPDVVLVDTRNDYEVELGTFVGAIDPRISTFSSLPGWVDDAPALRARSGRKPKIAMFCTGGIRCEKSTALMKAKGYEDVYHLEGGILKYLEQIAPQDSLWQGQCFVFDERVSVGHGLIPGPHKLCRCCRQPVSAAAEASDLFELGVSCPRCFDQTTDAQKNSARERQKQCDLAQAQKRPHVGAKQNMVSKRI